MKKLLSLLLCELILLATPAQAISFLVDKDIPQSFIFLPQPPQEGSLAFELDKTTYQQTRELRGSERWKQAIFDANVDANWPDFFKKALGFSFSQKNTPTIYALLSKIKEDLSDSTAYVKIYYHRVRPFIYFGQKNVTCFPDDEEKLANNSSFPSGHTIYGWSTALILAELFPKKKEAIFKRGYEYGQSRVICGFHWQSDVNAGFIVAAAAVALFHNNHDFIKMLNEAKKEAAILTSSSSKP
ncbi:MAG: hypothetical protein AMR96_02620 [Candidatus Adiutrix intracellularis]|nr:MAG: hypothetical protein AMR96_02620 [Candidatus Adiutrix intracellularis]MDR2826757.1 phosphatase PAP2 family protein [Candidatus Adiutrix intracellularis]